MYCIYTIVWFHWLPAQYFFNEEIKVGVSNCTWNCNHGNLNVIYYLLCKLACLCRRCDTMTLRQDVTTNKTVFIVVTLLDKSTWTMFQRNWKFHFTWPWKATRLVLHYEYVYLQQIVSVFIVVDVTHSVCVRVYVHVCFL